MDTRTKLHNAFAYLQALGFVAPMKAWQCCQGCGCAALPEGTTKFVFYHEQDLEHFRHGQGMYLSFGETVEDGQTIAGALNKFDVPYDWDGTTATRINVYPKEKL